MNVERNIAMFTINGNLKEFTQWEQGYSLTNPNMKDGDKIQFHSGSGMSYIMEAKSGKVEVPNRMLQHAANITAQFIDGTDDTSFAVKPAKKPKDYVFIDNECKYEEYQSGSGGGGVSSWYDLQDRPFYCDVKGEVTAFDNEVVVEENQGMSFQSFLGGCPNGGSVKVVIDGKEYTVKVATLEADGTYGKVAGNLSLVGIGENTGEPFVIVDSYSDSAFSAFEAGILGTTNGTHTVKVTYTEMDIKPIPVELLPTDIGTSSGGIMYVNCTYSTTTDQGFQDLATDKSYGEIYGALAVGLNVIAKIPLDPSTDYYCYLPLITISESEVVFGQSIYNKDVNAVSYVNVNIYTDGSATGTIKVSRVQ